MKRIKITQRDEIVERIKTHGIAHTDLGIFERRVKKPRRIHDMRTRTVVEIPEKTHVGFRMSEWLSRVLLE